MIRFHPYPIVVSGNREDDRIYERYRNAQDLKKLADRVARRLSDGDWPDSGLPEPKRPTVAALNDIERKPASGPEAEAYERAIHAALTEILKWRSGRRVLEASRSLPDDLYILPPGLRDRTLANFEDSCDGMIAHISVTNQAEKVPPIKMGLVEGAACSTYAQLYDTTIVLLHELVHGVRPKASSRLKARTLGDQWSDVEEFFGVVVENIFRSERGDRMLRNGHRSEILPEDAVTSDGFLRNATYRKRCEDLYRREKLAQRLGRLREIRFNPFAVIAGARRR